MILAIPSRLCKECANSAITVAIVGSPAGLGPDFLCLQIELELAGDLVGVDYLSISLSSSCAAEAIGTIPNMNEQSRKQLETILSKITSETDTNIVLQKVRVCLSNFMKLLEKPHTIEMGLFNLMKIAQVRKQKGNCGGSDL